MTYEAVDSRYESYLGDESRMAGTADGICFPENVQALRDAVAGAPSGVPITLQGARTGVAGGAVPTGGVILNCTRMDRIVGLRRICDSFHLMVEAGCTLEGVQEYLRRPQALGSFDEESRRVLAEMQGAGTFRFSPNPTETTACIGGLFGCNAVGLNSLGGVPMGGSVGALGWVTPEGDLWKWKRGEYVFDDTGCALLGGGRLECCTGLSRTPLAALVPRPGDDLIDFLAGSEGQLGVAARLSLRLDPVPAHNWGVLFFFAEDAAVMKFASFLTEKTSDGTLQGLTVAEYFDGAVLGLLREHQSTNPALKQFPPFPVSAGSCLYLELCGGEEEGVLGALEVMMEGFAGAGGQDADTWAAGSAPEVERFRSLRHTVPELLNSEVDRVRPRMPGLTRTTADHGVSAALSGRYLSMYHRDIAEEGLRGFVFGHLLSGGFQVHMLPGDEGEKAACEALMDRWAVRMAADGGRLAAENGVGRLRRELVAKHLSGEMRAQLDPHKRFGGWLTSLEQDL